MEKHTLEILEIESVRRIVAGYCATSLGREFASEMSPMDRREDIERALKETNELAKLVSQSRRLPLSGIHDIKKHIRQVTELNRPFEPEEILEIESTLKTSKSFKQFFSELEPGYENLRKLADRFEFFDNITSRTEKMVDRRGRVADDASERLKSTRKKIETLQFKLRGMIRNIIQSGKIRKFLQSEDVTLRNGRFVLPVKIHSRAAVRGLVHGKSASGETVYIEPAEIIETGNEYQDLLFDESREVTSILWFLTRTILGRRTEILALCDVLAWVDFTYGKAKYMIEYRLSIPEINDRNVVDLRKVRHPVLLSLARRANPDKPDKWFEDAVAADVKVGGDFSMLVITGPNTGGKTVLLKTVGLCTILGMCGCPIPASAGSTIPIFRNIMADIGDEQSIEQNLSTFSSHARRLAQVLSEADESTLVLLDELGAGTDPDEGAALSEAILEELVRRKARTLVSTHLGKLKHFAYKTEGVENASLEFDAKTLKPTYRLFMGQPGNSMALEIAGYIGIPAGVIESARRHVQGLDRTSEELIREMQRLRVESEDLKRRSEMVLEEAEEKRRALDERMSQLEKKSEVISREADEEVDAKLRDAKRKIQDALKELKNAPQPHADKAAQLERVMEDVLNHSPIEMRRQEFAKTLTKNMDVFVISFGKAGQIKKINKEKGKLTIQMGAITLETDFSNVSWLQ